MSIVKILILCLFLVSCSNVDLKTYIPQEIQATDSIIKIINDERHNYRLNELKPEKLLTELSKTKVMQMEANKELDHNGFTNLETNTETFSQIVGYKFKSEDGLFNGYMSSSEHRDKILGNFTHIGSFTYNGYNCIIFAKY